MSINSFRDESFLEKKPSHWQCANALEGRIRSFLKSSESDKPTQSSSDLDHRQTFYGTNRNGAINVLKSSSRSILPPPPPLPQPKCESPEALRPHSFPIITHNPFGLTNSPSQDSVCMRNEFNSSISSSLFQNCDTRSRRFRFSEASTHGSMNANETYANIPFNAFSSFLSPCSIKYKKPPSYEESLRKMVSKQTKF